MGRKKLITPRQVADAIQAFMLEQGVPPTLEDLQKSLKKIEDISTRTVLRYLDELVKLGMIVKLDGPRGLKLAAEVPTGTETIPIPFFGSIPAGSPRLTEGNAQAWIRLPRNILRPPSAKFYLVRVDGDSMDRASVAGTRLESGDLVLVRHQPIAEHGDVVTALVDGMVTLKRLIKKADYYVLMPDSNNPKHQSIIIGEEGQVQGVAIRVFKKGAELLNDNANKTSH